MPSLSLPGLPSPPLHTPFPSLGGLCHPDCPCLTAPGRVHTEEGNPPLAVERGGGGAGQRVLRDRTGKTSPPHVSCCTRAAKPPAVCRPLPLGGLISATGMQTQCTAVGGLSLQRAQTLRLSPRDMGPGGPGAEEGAAGADEGVAGAEEGAAGADEGVAGAEEGVAGAEEGVAGADEGAAGADEGGCRKGRGGRGEGPSNPLRVVPLAMLCWVPLLLLPDPLPTPRCHQRSDAGVHFTANRPRLLASTSWRIAGCRLVTANRCQSTANRCWPAWPSTVVDWAVWARFGAQTLGSQPPLHPFQSVSGYGRTPAAQRY